MMDVSFLENARDKIKNIFSNELESIKLGSAKKLEALKLAAAYVVLKDIFESEAGTDVKVLAATLVVLETISFLAENTKHLQGQVLLFFLLVLKGKKQDLPLISTL